MLPPNSAPTPATSWNSPLFATLSCKRGAPSASAASISGTQGNSLILNVDQRQRFLGDERVFSGDDGNRLADKTHPVGRDDSAIAQTVAIIGIDVFQIFAG